MCRSHVRPGKVEVAGKTAVGSAAWVEAFGESVYSLAADNGWISIAGSSSVKGKLPYAIVETEIQSLIDIVEFTQ